MIRNRRYPLRFILAGTTFAALLFTVPLLTQESFDPNSVQPTGCQGKGGKYDCGMKPPSAERMASIPLAPSAQIRHRGLPSRVDLSGNMPPIGNQGQQGSCVAWATGYALKSYHERVERNWSYDSPVTGGAGNRVFSPAYIYNQINGGRDDGSVIADALALMVRSGAAPWSAMPYNPNDYRTQPPRAAHQAAANYRAQSYKRLEAHNIDSIKAELSKGNPVVFGIGVDDAFYQVKSEVYDRNSGQFYGGHAMTLVGYDDSKRSPNGHSGAFKMINSWGTSWGDRGYAWISYRHWVASQPWALVMYDRTDSDNDSPDEPEQLEDLDDEQLQPPAQVNASQGTFKDKVVVNWAPVNGAVVYVVARAEPTNRDNFEYVGYAQETSYEDTAVQPDVAYRYIIVAAADRETYSDPQRSPIAEGYAKSQQQVTRPGQVTGINARVKAVAGRGAVSINWTDTPGATSYQVVRYDARSNKWAVISRSTRGTSFSDSKPVANQTNYYSVRAVNRAGQGPWGDPASVDIGGQSTAPEIPTGITATQGTFKSKIDVSWNSVPGASAYYVFRYDYNEEEWQGPKTVTSNSFSDDHPSVSSGAWFAYIVVAGNEAGNSDYSEPVLGKTNPNATRAGMVLPAPEDVKAKIGEDGSITISWKKVKGADEYYVFRKKEKADEYEFVTGVPGLKDRYIEKFPGEPGELYYYVIRTKSALGGESENSEAVAGFINKQRDAVRHRFLPGKGIERFTGKWTAMSWSGGAPTQYEADISANGGDFTISMQSGKGRAKTYKGSYVSESDIMETKDIKLVLTDVEGTLVATIYGRNDKTVTFTRQ